jgi:glycosyltransferase involved in cell wall biosynthesis
VSKRTFGIITAVYNVAPYLDDFFKSIVKQTLDFKRHIHLIVVDDGSTDNSSEIITQWQKYYPDNITCLQKENGGQASARNIGLDLIDTEWVTFIDADDFVHRTYFETIFKLISYYDKNDQISLVVGNFIYYFEKFKLKLNRHPLRHKYAAPTRPVTVKNLNTKIQLSVNNAFFKTEKIKTISLRFDERIRPTFEDAHFVNHYLLNTLDSSVIYAKSAYYYYRRRSLRNSTCDTSWSYPGIYDEVLKYGCLDLFLKAKERYGNVPSFLQYTVLYHLSWYYKYLMNKSIPDFVDSTKMSILLEKLFSFIDIECIENYPIHNIDIAVIEGWRQRYKSSLMTFDTVTLQRRGRQLLVFHYGVKSAPLHITYNQKPLKLIKTEEKNIMFLSDPFVHYTNYSVDLPSNSGYLNIESLGKTLKIFNGKTYIKSQIDLREISNLQLLEIKKSGYNLLRNLLLGKNNL